MENKILQRLDFKTNEVENRIINKQLLQQIQEVKELVQQLITKIENNQSNNNLGGFNSVIAKDGSVHYR